MLAISCPNCCELALPTITTSSNTFSASRVRPSPVWYCCTWTSTAACPYSRPAAAWSRPRQSRMGPRAGDRVRSGRAWRERANGLKNCPMGFPSHSPSRICAANRSGVRAHSESTHAWLMTVPSSSLRGASAPMGVRFSGVRRACTSVICPSSMNCRIHRQSRFTGVNVRPMCPPVRRRRRSSSR